MLSRSLVFALLLTLVLIPAQPLALAQSEPVQPPLERLGLDAPSDLPHLPSTEAAAAPAEPALAPALLPWSRLTFQSLRNEKDWEVYAGQDDNSGQVNLTNHGASDTYPRFNRGATRIAYVSNRDGNYEIYTMNADGSGRTRLTNHGANDIRPAWSPDGSRIIFQSYRDGQAELYTMNADGSGLHRLTNYGDYDGEPAWSPDGTQIAFTRKSSGQYRIWVMNADGSNPHQLSNQANSENPAWSPDGRWIAYDADGDGNGWQEVWSMDAGGGNQRHVYTPWESQTDAWVRSWSPDGQYIAFTRISFIQYQGNWYWTDAYLDALDTWNPYSSPTRLSYNGMDWHPDWQTTDAQPPTSQVLALPGQSPATFTVRWTGSDAGASGLSLITVQVRDGAGGAWTDWRSSSTDQADSFTGIGGHTYYFRAQARDNAYNMEPWPGDYDTFTKVEALPPQTAVEALPRYSRNGVLVHWGGSDAGGSGIQSYDVQVRAGTGAWTDWQMGTQLTSAPYSGTPGETYSFRARGTDRAQNVEGWPVGADATTILYAWAIRGQATDNRGAPVADMTVTTAPAALHTEPADRDGAYAAYVTGQAANYTATWNKPTYGSLPATAYAPDRDATVNVVLPPLNNVVQNWGFEDGNAAWQFSGSLSGTITTAVRHSGTAAAALLGSETAPLGSVTTLVTPLRDFSPPVDTVIDAAGTIHSAWLAQDGRVMYSRKAMAAPWTTPAPLPDPPAHYGGMVKLAADATGTIHVVWIAGDGHYYSRSTSGAAWSTPELIPGTSASWTAPGLAVSQSGVVKLVSAGPGTGGAGYGDAYFSERRPDGVWTSPRNISLTYGPDEWFRVQTDPAGRAHVLWNGGDTSGYADILYSAQTDDGAWSPVVNLSEYEYHPGQAALVIDSQGAVHAAWNGEGVYYRYRLANGSWSPKQLIAPSEYGGMDLRVDGLDRIHLVWGNSTTSQVYYAVRSAGAWQAPTAIAPATAEPSQAMPHLAVQDNARAHVAWVQYQNLNRWSIRYTAQDAHGQWQPATEVFQNDHDTGRPTLLVDGSGTPHALWTAHVNGAYAALYAGPSSVQDAGEAVLSHVVQVPDVPAPTLSFMYRFGSDFTSNSRLEAVVEESSAEEIVFSTNMGNDAWQHAWADLTPWARQTVTLRFRLIQVAGGARASAYIDEVSLGSAQPDIWVSLAGQSAAAPGGTAAFTIGYGNRGGVAAANARVTLQLPAELAFVSADPPPTATTPELRWDVGTLAAQSAEAIHITLRVADTAARGTTVTSAVAIASDTAELEEGNNTAEGTTYIGHQARLPIISR